MEPLATAWRRWTPPSIASRRLDQWSGLFVLLIALLAAPVLQAQDATGVVQGRVLNIGNNKYLNNARVVVEGTTIETQTNEYGDYRLTNVPAGEVNIRAVFTGLDAEVATVTVTPGQTAVQDFNLSSRARYGDDKTVVLDTFVVAASREFEANAIATNEQRYAPNIKVVMAADAFGDVTEGNAGEFLKYLPGVTVDYVAADVRTASVRGFASNFTNVYLDGMRTTSSNSGQIGRVFEFEQVSINNAARVEVSKVPPPDTPADSLGGSINLVSKNSFEEKGASFKYRADFNFNSEDRGLFKQTPGPTGRSQSNKVLPGFDFTYILPFSDRFGIVITGLDSNQFNEQHRNQHTWNFAQGGATPANPFLQQWQLQDGPKKTFRDSVSVKADWKITDNQTLSVMAQENYYRSFFANRNLNFNIGTTLTSAVTAANGGVSRTSGANFVQSATGRLTSTNPFGDRAQVTRGSSFRNKNGATGAVNFKYNLNLRDWNVDAGGAYVQSRTWYRELARGQFSNVGMRMLDVGSIRVDNLSFPNLDYVVRNTAGAEIDPTVLSNYRLTTARNSPIDGKARQRSAFLNAERKFTIAGSPVNLKAGLDVREEDRDNRRYQEDYTFIGADGLANSIDDNAGPFLDEGYIVDPGWGHKPIQWLDPFKLADHFRAHPEQFRLGTNTTQANGVQAEIFRRNNSEKITETVKSGFVQLDGKLFNNKLRYVAGVRYEKTIDRGEGVLANPDAVWQRNPDGSFVDGNATTAGVQRVRRVEAGAAGSLAELDLIRLERGFKARTSYDGFYPSAHLTYNVLDNLIIRAAYAKTIGRPDFTNIVPNTTIDENDTDPTQPGILTVRNTNLKPWTGDNYDLSLEYYFDKGGLFTLGGFRKDLDGFFVVTGGAPVTPEIIASLGLDDRFLGWSLNSLKNGGKARITGAEFSFIRDFSFLPGWGRYVSLSANGTMLHLQGESGTDFRGFIPKSGTVSLSWNKKPVSARVSWNYRGRQRNAPQTGGQYGATNGFFEYFDSRYNLDVNLEYKFSKQVAVFANGRNITNRHQVLERQNATSPDFASGFRDEFFGVQWTIGVKGEF